MNKWKQNLRYIFYSKVSKRVYPVLLKHIFYKNCGYKLSLKNPQTFNEKIQWMKLYSDNDLKGNLSDKIEVRGWVERKIGKEYLIPILGEWESFEKIDFTNLPNQFVLKTNHGSGYVEIVENKQKIDYMQLKSKFDKWMKINFAFMLGFELQYKNINPRIYAEEYLLSKQNKDLLDYKIYCFHGKPTYIQVIGQRDKAKGSAKEAFFDVTWKKCEFGHVYPQYEENELPSKPFVLDKMLEIAEILSKEFKFVRVDLYVINEDSIKFGEMTFTPLSGLGPWNPYEWDLKLGNLLDLNKEGF